MLSTADPSGLVASVFARVFAPAERLDAAAWAEAHRVVAGGAVGGAWSFGRTPYLRGICLAYSDPAVRRVSVMKAEQVGGTEAMLNCLFWSMDQRSGAKLWVYPNDRVATRVNKKRMQPSLRACPRIAEKLGPTRGDQTNMEVTLADGSSVVFTGSNSDANLEAFSYRDVLIDEVDRCVDGVAGKIKGRGAAWPDKKIYENGTPTDEGAGIDAAYAASDRCRWWTPCPVESGGCGHYHVRDDFSQVSWPMEPGKPLSADAAEAERSAWYECPACGHRINAAEHQATSARGLWLPNGWEVDEWGRERLEGSGLRLEDSGPNPASLTPQASSLGPEPSLPSWCVAQIPEGVVVRWADPDSEAPPPSPHAGFHITGEMSTIVANPFGNVAAEFIESNGRPGVEWLNRRRGCPWRAAAKRVEIDELRRLCVPVGEGGYLMGQVPRGVLALTLTVDVQAREAYCEVRGWGPGGRQSALVWCEVVEIDAEAGRFGRLVDVMRMRFSLRDDPSKTMGIGAAGIDSGSFTDNIYTLVAQLRAGGMVNLWPVKGDGGKAIAQPIVETRLDMVTKVRAHRGGHLTLLRLKTNYWKQWLLGRIHGEEELVVGLEAGGEIEDGARRFMLPADTPDEYLLQLTAEERVIEHVAGQPVYVFRPRRGFGQRNHYFDTATYAGAIARRAGVEALGAAPAPQAQPRNARENRPGMLARAGRGMLDRGKG